MAPAGIKVLVVATHNRKKGREMTTILGRQFPGLEVRTLADYPGSPEPEEDGGTYAENALIKARSAAAFTGEWSVSDDAGLEIDAFDGQPGLHSKRFLGEETPFPEKMRVVLERMRSLPEEARGARFRSLVALVPPSPQAGEEQLFEGVCEGAIALEQRGSNGFGYDPVFLVPGRGCTMAELTADEKHAISHRGMALAKLAEALKRLGC